MLYFPVQESLDNKGFGQDLPTVECEVEEHNIFHSEVEALAPHIATGGDKVEEELLHPPSQKKAMLQSSIMLKLKSLKSFEHLKEDFSSDSLVVIEAEFFTCFGAVHNFSLSFNFLQHMHTVVLYSAPSINTTFCS